MIGTLSIVFSILLHLVGFSTTYWYKNGSVHSGIWKWCNPTNCYNINLKGPDADTMYSVQTIEIITSLCYLIVFSCITLKMHFLKERKGLYPTICINTILGAVFGIIGVIMYTTLDSFQWSTIHFSFVFMIIASIGGIIGSVLVFLGYRSIRQYSEL